MAIAVYPGNFDPVTNGHLDIVNRAAMLFDELVIGIYDIPETRMLFTADERVALTREAVTHLSNVRVQSYSGLTTSFAKQMNSKVIVRGLRINSDFEREFEMALMNKKLDPDIELVCLMSSLQFQFLSSSSLKEACQLGGRIDDLAPPHVAKALALKFNLKLPRSCHGEQER